MFRVLRLAPSLSASSEGRFLAYNEACLRPDSNLTKISADYNKLACAPSSKYPLKMVVIAVKTEIGFILRLRWIALDKSCISV